MTARQRASQAQDGFARVGTAPVSPLDENNTIISASDNAAFRAIKNDSGKPTQKDGDNTDGLTGEIASKSAGRKASGPTGRAASKNDSRARRRVGRPRGPERVALAVRILAVTDARLTAAVEATGQSPQYVVDAALAAYLDALGI